jgi:hypothetical protein
MTQLRKMTLEELERRNYFQQSARWAGPYRGVPQKSACGRRILSAPRDIHVGVAALGRRGSRRIVPAF